MERYFFDIQSGREFFADEEGLRLPDQKAAEVEAMQTLTGIARGYSKAVVQIWQWKCARRLNGFSAYRSSIEVRAPNIEAACENRHLRLDWVSRSSWSSRLAA